MIMDMCPVRVCRNDESELPFGESKCQLPPQSVRFLRCDFTGLKGLTDLIGNHIPSLVTPCNLLILPFGQHELFIYGKGITLVAGNQLAFLGLVRILGIIRPVAETSRNGLSLIGMKGNESGGCHLCNSFPYRLQKKTAREHFSVLFQLQQLGYEIKRGKHVSVKGGNQKRFVRLSSLPEGYREAEIRATISGEAKREGRPHQKPEHSFNLLIDIQSKLQSKGQGFKRWATVYNLKQMSKTLLFLRDNKIDSVDHLNVLATEKQEQRDRLLFSIQAAEKRLAEIAALKTQIINYSKTRTIYEAYRKAGYSKSFLEKHRKEIMIHKVAKAAFDALGIKKLPKVKDLSLEYEQVLEEKKAAYAEYRQVKKETQELWIAQRNIASLYAVEREADEESQRREEKKQR